MPGFPQSNPFSRNNQLPYSRLNNPPDQQPYPSSSQPYPYANMFPEHPYPSQVPYPNQTSNMMGGNNAESPGYPQGPGYPTSPNAGGYPGNGGYPNTGGYSNPGAVSPAGFNPEVCPTAPDFSQMETFDEAIVMPPPIPEGQPEPHERKQVENLPSFTVEDAREAAIQFTSEHCCYGSGAAKNMVINDITMMSVFHYKLETFGEKRKSALKHEPYRGQSIDGPMNGRAPKLWDVVVSAPDLFTNLKVKAEVPHTAFVKPCHTCVGNGRVRCDNCHGNGRANCIWCLGRGTRCNLKNERCTSCEGTGRTRCSRCSASGQVKCKTCDGKGQLKVFKELIITWTNHIDDYISETSGMPKELVREVTGQTAFKEEYPRVHPIMHAPDEAVRNASKELISKHSSAFPNERILKQRQTLRLIPIGEVRYQWKEKTGMFYVYGNEHKVYFDKYPQKCCCCTII